MINNKIEEALKTTKENNEEEINKTTEIRNTTLSRRVEENIITGEEEIIKIMMKEDILMRSRRIRNRNSRVRVKKVRGMS